MTVESFYLFVAIFLIAITVIILGATIHTARVRDKHFQEMQKRVNEHREKIENRLREK